MKTTLLGTFAIVLATMLSCSPASSPPPQASPSPDPEPQAKQEAPEPPKGVEFVGPEGRTEAVFIDFATVTPQTHHIYAKMGSTSFVVRNATDQTVELATGGEVEMGEKTTELYVVPRSKGRLRFDNKATGLDFSSLEAFRKK